MNNTEEIVQILSSSGLNVLGVDNDFIYIEDPSCVVRAFETFANYAWIVICLITAMLFFVWAFSMIRGVEKSAETTSKNFVLLMIIFGVLSAAGPILNFFYRGDLFGAWCKKVPVSISEVNKLMSTKMDKKTEDFTPYTGMDIVDSGPTENTNQVSIDDAMKSVEKLENISEKIDKELSAQ